MKSPTLKISRIWKMAAPNPNVLSYKQTYITQQNVVFGLKPILY